MTKRTRLLSLSAGLVAVAAFAWQQKSSLPAPYATPSATNGPKVVARPDDAHLQVPKGFEVEEYASGFQKPRFMLTGPKGEILLSDSLPTTGAVYVLSGVRNPERKKLIENLDRPYGLALWKDYLYVAEATSVKRYKYDSKALTVAAGEEIIAYPKDFIKGHWTRSLLIDPKAQKLYVGVGSSSNVGTGDDPIRAAINRYNLDGSGHEVFASGTRNPIGMHWLPGSNTLWAAIQERDGLGDDLVPDFFTHIQQGGFYGWPYAYVGPNEEPRTAGQRPDLVKQTIVPDVLLPSHVAVLDYAFYTGRQFPAAYRGGAFLAYHGSSNRAQRVGYSVVFIPFKDGKPSGPAQDFLTGWMMGPDQREVWGRPVAVCQMADGSLLVSEDGNNRIWRVSFKG